MKNHILSKIAIIETDVYGALGYHAECFTCGWKSKRFNNPKTAIRHSSKHHDKKHSRKRKGNES